MSVAAAIMLPMGPPKRRPMFAAPRAARRRCSPPRSLLRSAPPGLTQVDQLAPPVRSRLRCGSRPIRGRGTGLGRSRLRMMSGITLGATQQKSFDEVLHGHPITMGEVPGQPEERLGICATSSTGTSPSSARSREPRLARSLRRDRPSPRTPRPPCCSRRSSDWAPRSRPRRLPAGSDTPRHR